VPVDSPNIIETFPVPDGAWALAFDGANVSVTNYGFSINKVTKLRASDRALLGAFDTGPGPISATFDGTSIWVANEYDDSVTKITPPQS
jgi:hypothetical protein